MRPHDAGKFLTAAQQAAWDSGNRDAIQAADDAALAQALMASLAELETAKNQDDVVTEDDLLQAAITESLALAGKGSAKSNNQTSMLEYLDIQAKKTSELRTWFTQSGFDIVRNSGGGSNNCLLISLLQHATGDYSSEHAADVHHYRQQLMKWDKTIQATDPLPSSGEIIKRLINQIIKDKGSEHRFAIAGPGLGSEPSWHFYGEGKDYAIIFDQSGHYEAVIPRKTKQP